MIKTNKNILYKYLELIKLSDEFDEKNNYQYSNELALKYDQYLCDFKYNNLFNKLELELKNTAFVETDHSRNQKIVKFSNLNEFQKYVCNNFLELRKNGGWSWYFYLELMTDRFWAISYREDVFMFETKSKD